VDAYIHAMVELWKFFKRPLERLTCEEVQRFLVVTYTWRDRRDGNTVKTDRLTAEEFTRRFCSHILPEGFVKIRYFGWLSAAKRKTALPAIRAALNAPPPEAEPKKPLAERILENTGIDITLCPHCGKGHLRNTGIVIPPQRGPP
jgi:hypothetical protein